MGDIGLPMQMYEAKIKVTVDLLMLDKNVFTLTLFLKVTNK